ncbi:CaiB/BaiF CoA transferase family protein [Dactylosporangium sp. CA-233914]|uniref:CaiB/BaiF CoA transferase family protein n=1 Tax=Dactylosporangium sp. CA-233914 TaxID=3239934 RepID=UPI003D92B76E
MSWTPSGPLYGVTVLEAGGTGPVPFAATLLADMGATVVRVDTVTAAKEDSSHLDARFSRRSRRSIALDLKSLEGKEIFLRLVASADVLLEGFRPGVMERLDLGPSECARVNRGLIYGRVTGWGREGPLAGAAGHDINYVALSGALHATGTATSGPVQQLNILGDYAGGAMFLAFGVVCALHERGKSGVGDVVDAAMLDGALYLTGNTLVDHQLGRYIDERGVNDLDGGTPYYGVYETADGKHVTIAPGEAKFWERFCELVGIDLGPLPTKENRSTWQDTKNRLQETFRSRTRDEWTELLEGTDACFAPVISLREVPVHRQIASQGKLRLNEGVFQPAPTPRMARAGESELGPSPRPGADSRRLLLDIGYSNDEIDSLMAVGVVAETEEPLAN